MKTADDFLRATGNSPIQDDLERVNCPLAGAIGHLMCGWCKRHDGPMFYCACMGRNGICNPESPSHEATLSQQYSENCCPEEKA